MVLGPGMDTYRSTYCQPVNVFAQSPAQHAVAHMFHYFANIAFCYAEEENKAKNFQSKKLMNM